MRNIVSIFLVTFLTLTFQSIASGEKNENSVSHELSQKQLATTIKSAIDKVIGRNGEMMMNMSASLGHGNGTNDFLMTTNMILMMCETLVKTVTMLLDPIFKVKNNIFTLITTLIAVGKFIMDLKMFLNAGMMKKPEVSQDRIGMPYDSAYRPTYFAHYPSYMPKYRVPL